MKSIIKIISSALLCSLISQAIFAGAMTDEANTASDSALSAQHNAINQLLDDAATFVEQQNFAKAAAALERALRIDPKNPEIWHLLGQVRLHQGQYLQAAAMAEKSNELAANNSALRARNQHLLTIAQSLSGGDEAQVLAEANIQAETENRSETHTTNQRVESPLSTTEPESATPLTIEINQYAQAQSRPERGNEHNAYNAHNEHLHWRQLPDSPLAQKHQATGNSVAIRPSNRSSQQHNEWPSGQVISVHPQRVHPQRVHQHRANTQHQHTTHRATHRAATLPPIDLHALHANLIHAMHELRIKRHHQHKHWLANNKARLLPPLHRKRMLKPSLKPSVHYRPQQAYVPFISPRQ